MYWYKRDKYTELKNWHHWFAWYPVKVSVTPDGDKKYVWLKKVFRCYHYHGWYVWKWHYAEIER